MKKRLLVVLCLLLFLTGCSGSPRAYTTQDYTLSLPYQDDFRILQLCDIHLANKDNRALHYRFLDLTIQDAKANLIVLDGDSFTFADKTVALELFDFLDSYQIPWTMTFGNHDEQCYFPMNWLTSTLNEYGSFCYFRDLQDDDVFGNSNFVINLTREDQVVEQVIVMDSNRYHFGDYWGYDYIKPDQIDWYERVVTDTAAANGGEVVPSLLFFHIPLPEFKDAWEAVQSGSGEAEWTFGDHNEGYGSPKHNSGFFDRIVSLGSTRGIFVGHDHRNNDHLLYRGVLLCHGIHSTDRIYYEENLLGGLVIILRPDHSLDFEAIYHTYSEVQHE